MIEFLLLSAGVGGTAAALWYAAPAGRGLHRYVVPRARLRAEIARLEREADELTCAVLRLSTENTTVGKDRDAAYDALAETRLRNVELGKQLVAFDQLCSENTQLRAALANARAVRPLPTDDEPTVPQGIPVLPLARAPFALKPGEPE